MKLVCCLYTVEYIVFTPYYTSCSSVSFTGTAKKSGVFEGLSGINKEN